MPIKNSGLKLQTLKAKPPDLIGGFIVLIKIDFIDIKLVNKNTRSVRNNFFGWYFKLFIWFFTCVRVNNTNFNFQNKLLYFLTISGSSKIFKGGKSFVYFLISTNVEWADGPCASDEVPISSVNTFGLPCIQ